MIGELPRNTSLRPNRQSVIIFRLHVCHCLAIAYLSMCLYVCMSAACLSVCLYTCLLPFRSYVCVFLLSVCMSLCVSNTCMWGCCLSACLYRLCLSALLDSDTWNELCWVVFRNDAWWLCKSWCIINSRLINKALRLNEKAPTFGVLDDSETWRQLHCKRRN